MQEKYSTGGVLPSQWIRQGIEKGIICANLPIDKPTEQIQPNSLDVRLDSVGYRVRCSFLPGITGIDKRLSQFAIDKFEVSSKGTVLYPDQPYIFPLQETLNLPQDVYARANPKSTTGRLDVFTRLVTENGSAFDEVPHGYCGRLFLEVVPRSFSIKVRPGDRLAQIRFQKGNPCLSDLELKGLLDREDILLTPDHIPLRSQDVEIESGVTLAVHLPASNKNPIGYQARKSTPAIDLQARHAASEADHWDRVKKPVILDPDAFYLFRSHELVRLPPQYCAEMVAFDASSGEVRTHYAGFFDSGFGYEPDVPASQSASAVVLEVRSRDVPFLIEDKQPIFRVHILRCTEEPDVVYSKKIGSNYQTQGLRLPKQFKPSDVKPAVERSTTLFGDGEDS